MLTFQQKKTFSKFADASDKLFELGIIRTDSFTGEIGEYYASIAYKFELTGRSAKGVDGISKTGKKYQVKAKVVSGNFNYTIKRLDTKAFDYLIVVYLDDLYQVLGMLKIPSKDISGAELRIMNSNLNSFSQYNLKKLKIPAKIQSGISKFAKSYKEVTNLDFIRNRKIVGEVGEYYASKALGLDLATSSGQKGYDAIDKKGKKFEIKTRRVYDSGRRISDTRRLNNLKSKTADFLIVVIIDRDFLCTEIWLMPMRKIVDPRSANLSNIRYTEGIKKVDFRQKSVVSKKSISKPKKTKEKIQDKEVRRSSTRKKKKQELDSMGCLFIIFIVLILYALKALVFG